MVSGIVGLQRPIWSPDSSRLAFSGTIGGQEGTWLYGRAAKSLKLLVETPFEGMSWSPDGATILGVVAGPPDRPLDSNLVLVEVP